MPCTKGAGQLVLNSVVNSTNSAAIDISTNYATDVYIDMVVVGTATNGAQVQIQLSPDGNTYYSPGSMLVVFPTTNGTYDQVVTIAATSAIKYKAIYTQQVNGTSSTCLVQDNYVSGV